MTTNTTLSSTGTARRRRRTTKVSIRRRLASRLFLHRGLPEGQVVLDGVNREAFHGGAGDDDLLRRVHGDLHYFPGQDVLHLAVELLAFGLVEAAARLFDQGVDP